MSGCYKNRFAVYDHYTRVAVFPYDPEDPVSYNRACKDAYDHEASLRDRYKMERSKGALVVTDRGEPAAIFPFGSRCDEAEALARAWRFMDAHLSRVVEE